MNIYKSRDKGGNESGCHGANPAQSWAVRIDVRARNNAGKTPDEGCNSARDNEMEQKRYIHLANRPAI
jgi:hypothetical protein